MKLSLQFYSKQKRAGPLSSLKIEQYICEKLQNGKRTKMEKVKVHLWILHHTDENKIRPINPRQYLDSDLKKKN
jgi:hypothetical protein